MVNLNALIATAAKKLELAGIDTGAVEAELVLCDLLDFDRLHLYLHGPSVINDQILSRFHAIIDRRTTRYPLQYILGSAWFYGRRFMVNEAVMVPCPETEQLLESVLRLACHCRSNPVRILDIGVGSGVVAVSAKLENEELDITAVDISAAALDVARANAERYELDGQIQFLESNLFSALDKNERFDIIASNPPYIAVGAYETLPPEVKADPVTALLAGEKGLDIIIRLVHQAPDFLNRPGFLIFEIGHDQSQAVFNLIERDGRYAEFSLVKDLADIDRIVVCKVDGADGGGTE